MNSIINKYVQICIISILILVTAFSAQAEDNVSYYNTNNEKKVVLLSKDDELEKVITNVKVIYNPIAQQISVSFKLNKTGNVMIKLMDALGNEVLNLSNTTLEAGIQNLSFETESKVSAGFYFVRVVSGVDTVVKRISIR